MHYLTIPGETPSLKNSKRIVWAGRYPKLVPSKFYLDWFEESHWRLKGSELIGERWQYPVTIDFIFYRRTRSRFDFVNLAQGPLDLLVEAGILDDDDMRHVIPGRMTWEVDKGNPRVEMVIREPLEAAERM